MKIKTIDINCKEWFDKTYGNSYFAGSVTVNYGMKDCKIFPIPFQYGYGSQYQYEAAKVLVREKVIKSDEYNFSLWQFCEKNNIILRSKLIENCKKKELFYAI